MTDTNDEILVEDAPEALNPNAVYISYSPKQPIKDKKQVLTAFEFTSSDAPESITVWLSNIKSCKVDVEEIRDYDLTNQELTSHVVNVKSRTGDEPYSYYSTQVSPLSLTDVLRSEVSSIEAKLSSLAKEYELLVKTKLTLERVLEDGAIR